MHDPFAFAMRMVPLAPQWMMGVFGQNSDVIRTIVHETFLHTQRQSELGLAAYRGALRARNPLEFAKVEFGYVTHSLRLACDAAGRAAQLAAQVNHEDVMALPIE